MQLRARASAVAQRILVTRVIIPRDFSGHITVKRRGDGENGRQFIEINYINVFLFHRNNKVQLANEFVNCIGIEAPLLPIIT